MNEHIQRRLATKLGWLRMRLGAVDQGLDQLSRNCWRADTRDCQTRLSDLFAQAREAVQELEDSEVTKVTRMRAVAMPVPTCLVGAGRTTGARNIRSPQ